MSEPVVIGFVCRWVADRIDDKLKMYNKDGNRVYQLGCVGNIPPQVLLEAFSKGADVVFLLGCGNGGCKYYKGNEKIENTKNGVSIMVEDLGLEADRVVVSFAEEGEEDPLARVMAQCKELAGNMAPSPYRS